MQNAQLTLLIPDAGPDILKSLKAKLPALKLLIDRSNIEELSINSWEALLCQAFGIQPSTELPIAALTGLADGLGTQSGFWLRVDPVQLQADLSAVYMVGNDALDLSEQELHAFSQELNSLFKQDQLNLFTPAAKRWYLQSHNPIQLVTHILKTVTGKNIIYFLPTGTEQAYWRKLFTEIQMLLYTCQANQQRAIQGLPVINGVWLWGAGQLPSNIKSPWQFIWSNDVLLKGLAKVANVGVGPPPTSAPIVLGKMLNSQQYLISLIPDTQLSSEEWLMQVEANWLSPLVTALRKKQLNSLAFYLGNNKLFHINQKTIRYFWRKKA